MTGIDRDTLRALVREVVGEAVREAVVGSAAPPTPTDERAVSPTGPLAADGKTRTETVRLSGDQDLDGFVRKLLRLFENPKTRADLRSGRLTFRLAGADRTPGGASHRIDSGVITERRIAEISGGTLILGRRAVLTPLAREKAGALGIAIEKERK